jgi:thioredoxin-related protein
MRFVLLVLFSAAALTSCGPLGIGKKPAEKKPDEQPFGPTGIPPQLRPKNPDPGTPVLPGGNQASTSRAAALTPEEDIVYTDPDDPDAPLPELSSLLANAKRGPWEESETVAKQRSAREGKPLLIWFTDSESSPMCKALSQELFSTNDFGNWATEKLVRLRVDAANIKIKDPNADLSDSESYRISVKNYYASLKKRYKVLGLPSLILLNPSGEVIGRYRGYKRGDADFLWGQLKHGEAVSSTAYQTWRKSLEKKGYRDWQDRRDRKVFAKLTSYSKGHLTFIEPDGTRSQTLETHLSDNDKAWLAEQKKLRNIP